MRAYALLACLCLGACASRPGHFYQDDGPPEKIPAGLSQTPDAVPRVEPLNAHANRPYAALGRSYTPDTGDAPFEQRGMASWYGRQYHGNATASGEPYDMYAMTAAHPTLPIPSYARVTRVSDGRSVIVRINDRGPFLQDRVIDLSYAAAARLGIVGPGSAEVLVQKITARDIAAGATAAHATPAVAPAPPGSAAPAASRATDSAATSTETSAAAAATPADPVPADLSTASAISTRVVASAQSAQELPLPPPPVPDGSDTAGVAPPVRPAAALPVAPAPQAPVAPSAAPPATPAQPATAAPPAVAKPSVAGPVAAPAAANAGTASAAAPDASAGRAPPDAAAPAKATAPAARAAAPSPRWSIQLGAFALPAHAQTLAAEVRGLLAGPGAEALPDANRAVRVEFDGRLHRVLVGGYDNRGGAQKGARQLQQFLDRPTTVYSQGTGANGAPGDISR